MNRRRIKQKRFDPLSQEMEDLVLLCRRGDLFGVQKWIDAGRPIEPGPGKFRRSPLRVAIETGFLSLVEVLLRAGIEDAEKTRALRKAMDLGRADIFDLLVRYGADHTILSIEEVIESRRKDLIEWYVQRGVDWEQGYPIAHSLARGQREFLGIYMGLRDKVPSAKMQATMALRKHCSEGRMRWVALLLWAGADPRLPVPDVSWPDDEDELLGTALEDAVATGRVEIVQKIGIDPARDNPTELLANCWLLEDAQVVELLLAAGADPNAETRRGVPMDRLMSFLAWSLDSTYGRIGSKEQAFKALELAAARGGRWRLTERGQASHLRRSLDKMSLYEAVSVLKKLLEAHIMEAPDFKQLVSTPKMKSILWTDTPGVVQLREAAGLRPRKKQRKR